MSLSRSSGTDDAMTYMVCGLFMVLVLSVPTVWCEEEYGNDEAGGDEEGYVKDGHAYWLRYYAGSHEWQQSHCAYSEDDEDSCDEVVCCFGIHVSKISVMSVPMVAPSRNAPMNTVMTKADSGSSGRFMVIVFLLSLVRLSQLVRCQNGYMRLAFHALFC